MARGTRGGGPQAAIFVAPVRAPGSLDKTTHALLMIQLWGSKARPYLGRPEHPG